MTDNTKNKILAVSIFIIIVLVAVLMVKIPTFGIIISSLIGLCLIWWLIYIIYSFIIYHNVLNMYRKNRKYYEDKLRGNKKK